MSPIERNNRRSGYTLLELLLGSVTLVLVASLSLELYTSFNRVRRAAEDSVERSRQLSELEASFRESVQASSRRREDFQGVINNESTLIVENAAADEVVVLRVNNDFGSFSVARWTKSADGWESSYLQSYRATESTLQFDHADEQSVRLMIETQYERPNRTVPEKYEIVATFREEGAT